VPSPPYPAPPAPIVDIARLQRGYFECRPEGSGSARLIRLRGIGLCGSPFRGTLTESHVLALAQAICDYRRLQSIDGPLYIGRDTGALSELVHRTVVEVLAANRVQTIMQQGGGATPAPVISRAVVEYNRFRLEHPADGIMIGASCNPPDEGGVEYAPPFARVSDPAVGLAIEARANELLCNRNGEVQRLPFLKALQAPAIRQEDQLLPYVHDLRKILCMDAIRHSGITVEVDALGGAASSYWDAIGAIYRLNISEVHRPGSGSPFLPVAANYLFKHRPGWPANAAIGKSMIGTRLTDRVANRLGRYTCELPLGFHWMAPGLLSGEIGFGGGEAKDASFLRHDGTVWTTGPDGIIINLLAAEITAVTGRDPGEQYRELVRELGTPTFSSVDVPATFEDKQKVAALTSSAVKESILGGEPITATLTYAPCNGVAFGGVKVTTANGWFAVLPSSSEDIYQIYAESFRGHQHLDAIMSGAQAIMTRLLQP
jgi:phosphoglucomutase